MPFYEKGDVRIHYAEVGSGFPLLVTPGGGLNSRTSNWPTAVINAMEEFKDDFRCITMDQRNANGGESSGPIPVNDPWGAFANDQLGLMDHLDIHEFFYMGYCIGSSNSRSVLKILCDVCRKPLSEQCDDLLLAFVTIGMASLDARRRSQPLLAFVEAEFRHRHGLPEEAVTPED